MKTPIDPTQILLIDEIRSIVTELRRLQRRSINSARHLAVFHLAVSAGLRAGEIALLKLRDLRTDADPPYVNVPTLKKRTKSRLKSGTKPRPRRKAWLNWFPDALPDLIGWKARRIAMGADDAAPLVCTLSKGAQRTGRVYAARTPILAAGQIVGHEQRIVRADTPGALEISGDTGGPGRPVTRQVVWRCFKQACKILGPARAAELRTHSGRHTLATWALKNGVPITEVRDMLGHSSLAVTDVYSHIVPGAHARPRNVYKSEDT